MKQKILSLALIAMSVVTFNGMAQTSSETTGNTIKENVCDDKATCRQKRESASPFAGMELSEEQQAKLKELNTKHKAERMKAFKAHRFNRQHLDSARIADRRTSRKAYLSEVKAIIGTDRYVTFLENNFINAGNYNGRAKLSKVKHGKAHDAKANRENRRNRHQGEQHSTSATATNTTEANL